MVRLLSLFATQYRCLSSLPMFLMGAECSGYVGGHVGAVKYPFGNLVDNQIGGVFC